MTKHDRLMKALEEIKSICIKNDNEETGCDLKCPFLMETKLIIDGHPYAVCEIVYYVDCVTPCLWAIREGN